MNKNRKKSIGKLDFSSEKILAYKNKQIKFCFKFCKFEKTKIYSNKDQVNKFFKKMIEASKIKCSDRDEIFIANTCNDLKKNCQKLCSEISEKTIIFDLFKKGQALRVYGSRPE